GMGAGKGPGVRWGGRPSAPAAGRLHRRAGGRSVQAGHLPLLIPAWGGGASAPPPAFAKRQDMNNSNIPVSFEFFPTKTDAGHEKLIAAAHVLAEQKPEFF